MRRIIDKIYTWDRIKEECARWKSMGKKIVFTNGCFDIIHKGHVHYIEEAAEMGDVLVIGVNSDLSISVLKGANRPIQNENGRLAVLAALENVDAVVLFEEDTPEELINQIIPDILVKGGDWDMSQIVGGEFVISHGGEVRSLRFIEGYSTTSIEQKILKQC